MSCHDGHDGDHPDSMMASGEAGKDKDPEARLFWARKEGADPGKREGTMKNSSMPIQWSMSVFYAGRDR